jgi:hypothetical protein
VGRRGRQRNLAQTCALGSGVTGHSCQAALEPTPSERLPILAAFSTLGPVRRTLRVTQRRAWASTNLSTAGIRGHWSPLQSVRSRRFRPAREPTEHMGRVMRSSVARSARSLLTQEMRPISTCRLRVGCGASVPLPAVELQIRRPAAAILVYSESTDGGATFASHLGWRRRFAWCVMGPTQATIRGANEVRLVPGWNGTTERNPLQGAFSPQNVAGSGGVFGVRLMEA